MDWVVALEGWVPMETKIIIAQHVKKSLATDSCVSVSGLSTRIADLPMSFWVFSESLQRRELAEVEMMNSREALQCEADKRRIEMEDELIQILVQTHVTIHPAARSPEEGCPASSDGVFLSRSQKQSRREKKNPYLCRHRRLLGSTSSSPLSGRDLRCHLLTSTSSSPPPSCLHVIVTASVLPPRHRLPRSCVREDEVWCLGSGKSENLMFG
ncbi:hypothetical protein Ddye_006450 [Dipteronia dyeriana]|uniref:Uncharacterized protein n=1 Tax=Dipteronia dyeriana TaxID=168575 RepID=A0AAD9XID6_9ROSI|nr:hypothetical protein Ddye_006450 [Dipteronia dyeriana]